MSQLTAMYGLDYVRKCGVGFYRLVDTQCAHELTVQYVIMFTDIQREKLIFLKYS